MDLHVYRNSQDRWRDLRAAARARGAVLASNAVTLDELVERLTPDLKTASPAQRLVLVERAVEQAGSGVGGPSDGPEKEAREAGVPAVGRTVGPTLGNGVGGPSDGPFKEAAAKQQRTSSGPDGGPDAKNLPGVARSAYDSIAELKGARVRGAELRRAGAETLAAILDAYNALIDRSGFVDPQDRVWIAASRVAEGHPWARQFESVAVHAIYDLTDAEFALLHNFIQLAPGGGTILLFNATANIKPTQFAEWTWRRFVQDEALADKTFPEFFRSSGPAKDLLERLFVFEPDDGHAAPLRPNGALEILQCPGRYREVEAIGSEIAELLDSGADANEIGVVVRHIETYGEMLEDVFTRYGIPHAFETGVPLLRIPFIKYWIALLDLISGDRPRDALARVLSSAYHEPRLAPATGVEKTLADIGYIDRLHLKASTLAARRGAALAPELERFESFLDNLEHTSARPMQFLAQLQPAPLQTDRDRQAWRILSDEIEAVDSLAGEISFARFRRMTSEIAGLRTIDRFFARQAAPGVPRVRVTAPRALGYRTYRWIFAPGFADGEIPASTGKSPLLTDAAIEALNTMIRPRRVMNSRDRNRREPLYLFMILDSGAERVTLSRPASTLEGEPIAPSIYIEEILRHYDPGPVRCVGREVKVREAGEFLRKAAAEWRNDRIDELHAERLLGAELVRRSRWERRGIARADLGAGSLPTDGVWSPSELNTLAACPFVFLARHRLKLRPAELPDFEVPPAEVGNLAHRILREFYGQPVSNSEQAALARMQEVIDRQLALVDIHGQGPSMVIDPALWKIRRPQLVRALLEYVKFAVADARDGYETLAEYLDRPLPPAALGDATLAGRPDHVAVRRTGEMLTGIRIDDFKYSAASGSTRAQLKGSFQIPVYAHLAATALRAPAGVPIEGRYLLLRSPSTPVVAQAFDSVVIDEVAGRIAELLEKVRTGKLHPDPADKQDCSACDYRRLCRLYGT